MPGANPGSGGFSWGTLANRPAPNIGVSQYYAIDNGVLYWSDGAVWHQSGTNDIGVVMSSGDYYIPVGQGVANVFTPGVGQLRAYPINVPHDLALSRLGGEVTAIGDVGSTVRLSVYADNGSGYPGALLMDAGTIAGDSATVQEIIINLALSAGAVWLSTAVQGAPVAVPTLRGITSGGLISPLGQATIPGVNALWGGVMVTGQAGASPNPFPAGATLVQTVARLFVKVA